MLRSCKKALSTLGVHQYQWTSGFGKQISEQFCCNVKGTGNLIGLATEIKTFHVLSYESSDKGDKEVIECLHLCELL